MFRRCPGLLQHLAVEPPLQLLLLQCLALSLDLRPAVQTSICLGSFLALGLGLALAKLVEVDDVTHDPSVAP